MAQLSIQTTSVSGSTTTYNSADSEGDSLDNNGMTLLYVSNDGSSSITVTVSAQKTCEFGFMHDITVDVATGEEKVIGTFRRDRFNDKNNNVQVTYSGTTSVQVKTVSVV